MNACSQCGAQLQAGGFQCWRCGVTLTGADLVTIPGPEPSRDPSATDPMIGRQIIGQYVVTGKIGEGGMGAVYLADQTNIGRKAVIKVLHPWLSKDENVVARFQTEARAAARLQNPHIVSIFNHGQMEDGTLFLAMEHLSGCTLGQMLGAEGRFDPARAVAIATQCCEALSEAHRQGVIHRDLKPSNIMMLARNGPDYIKVLDFGIAKLEGGNLTQGDALLGTPQYMSPEQLTGKPVDGRSDVYALGLLTYQMLCGRPPFVSENAISYVHLHTAEAPPALSQMAPDAHIPPALEACVMRALAKEPFARPQSADQFAEELWAALMATVEKSDIPIPRTRPKGPSSGAVIGATAVALGAVGALVVGGYFFLSGSNVSSGDDSGGDTPTAQQGDPPNKADDGGATPSPGPTPAVVPGPGPTPEALAKLSPETRALLEKPVEELEKELYELLDAFPPSTKRQIKQSYELAVALPPQGVDPVHHRKTLLIQWIASFRQSAGQLPQDSRSIAQLETAYLEMEADLPVDTRRDILTNIKKNLPDDENRDYFHKQQILGLIKAHGKKPG